MHAKYEDLLERKDDIIYCFMILLNAKINLENK